MAFETNIINIPDKKTLLIKGGVDQGINIGDEFRIISKGKEIIDPDSHEPLGTYDRVKAKLEVTQVYEKFSELKKIERRSAPILDATSMMTKPRVIIEELSIDESDIDSENTSSSNYEIKIGDIAQKL